MSTNITKRTGLILIAGLLIAVAFIRITFADTSKAMPPSRLKGSTVQTNPNTESPDVPKPGYVPGDVIVKLKDSQSGGASLSSTSYSSITTGHKATLLRLQREYKLQDNSPVLKGAHQHLKQSDMNQSRTNSSATTASVQNPTNMELLRFYLLKTEKDVPAVCSQLKNDPDVEYAQPNYIYKRCEQPNDPEFPDQYTLQLIQMIQAWNITTGSRDIVVAVLGTGVDIDHPDLEDNIWINEDEIADNGQDDDGNGYIDDIYGWNFESQNNEVDPEYELYGSEGHETKVAGVIAATGNNGIGITGVNWQCSIMALRLSLEITSAEIAQGLNYAAANDAHILNMSFGTNDFGDEDLLVSEAVNNAYNSGIMMTASAGNDDMALINYPAGYYNVMAVASTNGEDIKTTHSSFGPWVDIAAPGTEILTTEMGGDYVTTDGTSFSAPYVAAVGALVLSHRPDLTNVELRAILENTTEPIYYGIVNPDECYIGTGRVNAYQALLGADINYPLGEIVEPKHIQTFTQDVNTIDIVLFVHGETYQLEYTQHGKDDWTLISQGNAPTDPNGLVNLSMANPGLGTHDLRLSVTSEGYIHTDRKVFGFELGAEQESWPKPEEFDYTSFEIAVYAGGSTCMDIDGDGRNEIIQPQMTYLDSWFVGEIAIWDEDGTALDGWPQGNYYAIDTPQCAIGDVDGDGDYEVIGMYGYDCLVCAWHVENGELLDGDWPLDTGYWYGYIYANPVLADLDGDGDSEIIVAMDLNTTGTDGLLAIQDDGSFLWQRRYTTDGAISVADFDRDGNVEIALSGYGPGISSLYTYILDNQGQQIKRWRGGSNIGTAITDLDADGQYELIFCTDDSVKAVHIDGSTLWETDIDDPFGYNGSLSAGDIDDDGYGEVYIASNVESDGYSFTVIHAFDHEGKLLTDAGYPKTIMGTAYNNPPLIGDIDSDGQKELIAGMSFAPVIAWEADGSTTPGFPIPDLWTNDYCTPSIGDLDQDGDIELMVGGYDYRFHVIDLPGRYDPNTIDWDSYRHDPQRSGWTTEGPGLDLTEAPDQIKPGQMLELTVSITNPANSPLQLIMGNLPKGANYDANTLTVYWEPTNDQAGTHNLSFLVTDGIRQSSRTISIMVALDAIYDADMATDPNWLLDEGWAWGVPTGQGSWNGDPTSGFTGDNVIGYNLNGDYDNSIQTTRYATLGPVNCQRYTNIWLNFRRWLGVESPFDYANIQASNDGTNWVDIWTVGNSHIADTSWQLMEYTIPSEIADEQPQVYIRWGLGPTDDTVTYPGWNIDDVMITGQLVQ